MTETLKRGFPGMKSVLDMPIVQDAPPPGGFPAIRFERRLPSTGPTGVVLISVGAAIFLYGNYQNNQRKSVSKDHAQEIFAVRSIVHTVLQAEWDLRYLNHRDKEIAKEAEIMKDVPGWVPGEATTRQRWVPPLESFAARSLLY